MDKIKIFVGMLFFVSFLFIIIFLNHLNKTDEKIADKNYKESLTKSPKIIITPKPTKKRPTSENTVLEKTPLIFAYDEGYLDVVKSFRLAFIDSVNKTNTEDLNVFLLKDSTYEKFITSQIEDYQNKQIKLQLKSSKLISTKRESEFLYLTVEEELGIKYPSKKFSYEKYKIKYTIESTELGYIFEDEEKI